MGKASGAGLIGFGVFMGVGVLLNLGQGYGALAMLSVLGICCALPVTIGLRLFKGRRPSPALLAQADQAWASELMRLAERRGGALTVAEVVAYADLDAGRAERILDRLCQQGLAEHRITGEGQIVYRFAAVPSVDQKRRAEGVLDERDR